MQSGQAELRVLWHAWVDRFEGRRIAAAISFLVIPLVGYAGWKVESPAVGITAAAGIFSCFVFLVAFAMAHREAEARTSTPPTPVARPAATVEPVLAELEDGAGPAGPFTRFAG